MPFVLRSIMLILAIWAVQSAAHAETALPPLSATLIDSLSERDDWQCVPFARELSGIAIYGDAYLWWDQAEGHYARGDRPRVGAVMALRPYGAMQLGHVATVSRIVDARTILLTHANWSEIDGRRGRIERDAMARDVSDAGDWSEVRIWYAPIGDLGATRYPVYGFIYPEAPGKAPRQWAEAPARPARAMLAARAEPAPVEQQDDPIGDLIARLAD